MGDSTSEQVAATAEALLAHRSEVREAALARLEGLYVRCESGDCRTDPEVARSAIPYATRALLDGDPGVRVTGARALELLAADADEAIPDLAALLTDPEAEARVAALSALGEFGPSAAPAAAQVAARLAHGPTPLERALAADVLSSLDLNSEHVEVLIDALFRDVPEVQASVASTLARALEDECRKQRVSQMLHALLKMP